MAYARTGQGVAYVFGTTSQDLSLQDSSSPNGGHVLRPQVQHVNQRSLWYSFLAPLFAAIRSNAEPLPVTDGEMHRTPSAHPGSPPSASPSSLSWSSLCRSWVPVLRELFPYVHKRSLAYSFLAPHFCDNQVECKTSHRYGWGSTQDSFCALWMIVLGYLEASFASSTRATESGITVPYQRS